jgi:hypothetical protein
MPGWWKHKSWPTKAMTVLATILILQIGLCVGATDWMTPWYVSVFHPASGELGPGIDLAVLQAFLCLFTLALMLVVGLIWASRKH